MSRQVIITEAYEEHLDALAGVLNELTPERLSAWFAGYKPEDWLWAGYPATAYLQLTGDGCPGGWEAMVEVRTATMLAQVWIPVELAHDSTQAAARVVGMQADRFLRWRMPSRRGLKRRYARKAEVRLPRPAPPSTQGD